ncbi:MAG: DUF4367 domain-containing protein [Clostridiales bacterium]|nr:DUF4367 domain-containing protein [Clostridiales bacterium]
MKNFPFSTQALTLAAGKVRASMLDTMPSPQACAHTFSPTFEEATANLHPRKKHRQLRRIAAVLLAILLGSGLLLTVSPTARAAVFSWVREVYEQSVVYKFFNQPTSETLPDYRMQWMPEEFTLERTVIDSDGQAFIYVNKNDADDGVIFSYYRAGTGTEEHLMTDVSGEPVTVNGFSGYYYPVEEPDETNELIWIDDGRHIVFLLSSYREKSVMVHMAESIQLVSPTK